VTEASLQNSSDPFAIISGCAVTSKADKAKSRIINANRIWFGFMIVNLVVYDYLFGDYPPG